MGRNVRLSIGNALAFSLRHGDTRAICESCYLHTAVVDAYLDGNLVTQLQVKMERRLRDRLRQLRTEENAVLSFLRTYLSRRSSRPFSPDRHPRVRRIGVGRGWCCESRR